jgi:methyl-accepting chemotaxis protein
MKAFANLRIAAKLLVSFIAILALTVVVGVISIAQLAKVNDMSTEITTNWMPSTRTLLEIKGLMARYRTIELQHILSDTLTEMSDYEKAMGSSWNELQKDLADYEKLISEPEEREIFPAYKKALAQYAAEHDRVIALSRAQKKDDATAVIRGESLKINRELNDMIDKLAAVNIAGAAKANATADAVYARARVWVIGLLVGSIVVGLVLAVTIARAVARPLSDAVKIAQSVAAGDLTSRIDAETTDETGMLLAALLELYDTHESYVLEVSKVKYTIATA